MLQWPASKPQSRITRDNPSAKVFSPSGQAKQPKPSVSVIRGHTHTHTHTHTTHTHTPHTHTHTQNNDNACGSCGGLYSDDAKNNGTGWIKCTHAQMCYHNTTCQTVADELQCLCDDCEGSDDSE